MSFFSPGEAVQVALIQGDIILWALKEQGGIIMVMSMLIIDNKAVQYIWRNTHIQLTEDSVLIFQFSIPGWSMLHEVYMLHLLILPLM